MLRLFIAIELPSQVQEVIRATQAELARHPLPVRWVDPAGAHLTLKFLGSTPLEHLELIEAALQDAAQRHRPFLLQTARIGVFPNAKAPRVVWLGIVGDLRSLGAIQSDVEKFVAPLGYPTERRPFNAHLTLGRTLKSAQPADAVRIGQVVRVAPACPSVSWQVAHVSLMRSELGPGGARYSCIGAWVLTGKDALL